VRVLDFGVVDVLAEKLDARLREWKPETAAEARERVTEVIERADHDILDIARSRAAEQDVLDLRDEPNPVRFGWLTWDSLPRRVPSLSSPNRTLTHHDLSSCTCLSPPSGETVYTKCRCRGFRSSIVNQ